MVALIVLVAFESLAVATAMPVVGRALKGLALYALAFSGSLASGIIAAVLGGRWADRRGPVAPLWAGVAAFATGLLISGTAPTMDVFIAGRFVQGFGAGIFQVAMYVLVSRVYPADTHPRVFSIFGACWVVPSMVGPAVAGAVVEHLGWRWVFLGVPALVVPAALLLRRGLASAASGPASPPPEAGARTSILRKLAWTLLTAVGAALMQYGGAARGTGRLLLATGTVALALSLPRLLPPGTLRAVRGLPAAIMLRGIAAGTVLGSEAFLPLMLTGERDLSPTQAGMVLTSGALAWSSATWIVGHRRFDRSLLLRTGPGLIAVGVLLMALTVFRWAPVPLAVLGEIIVGFGIGIVYPTLSVLVLELSNPGEEGENSASLGIAELVFTVVTIAVAGAILATLGAVGPVYLGCFALTALMASAGVLVGGAGRHLAVVTPWEEGPVLSVPGEGLASKRSVFSGSREISVPSDRGGFMPRVRAVEVFRLVLPYGRRPESILVRLTDYGGMTGWGEVVDPDPKLWTNLEEGTGRALIGVDWEHPVELSDLPGGSAVDMACWDLWGRMRGVPLSHALGGSRTSLMATVRIRAERNLESLIARVNRHVCAGYAHVTLDIHPGWDIEPLRAVRRAYPALGIGVDARAAYTDARVLQALDAYTLSSIERPFVDIRAYADLQRRVAAPVLLEISSLVELDEAIGEAVGQALLLRPAAVGSLEETRRMHDAARAAGWEIACAGGQGTGLARAATVAVASLPGCALPCDVAEPPRSAQIVTPPVGASGGVVAVPLTQPGLGHTVDVARVRRLARESYAA